MALALYFAPKPPMSAKVYDECVKRLDKAGAGHPRGRLYHACFGTTDSVAVFDVWTSQAAFEAFGKILMPIMQQLGGDPGQPHVMPIHNVIVPPFAKGAARKPAAKKRAAAPKGKATHARKGKKR